MSKYKCTKCAWSGEDPLTHISDAGKRAVCPECRHAVTPVDRPSAVYDTGKIVVPMANITRVARMEDGRVRLHMQSGDLAFINKENAEDFVDQFKLFCEVRDG